MSKHNNLIVDAHNAERTEAQRLIALADRINVFLRPADTIETDYIIDQLYKAAVRASDYQIVQCPAGDGAWISRINEKPTPHLVNRRRAKKGEFIFILETSDHEAGAFLGYGEALSWAVEILR